VPTRQVRQVIELLLNVLNTPNPDAVVNNNAGDELKNRPNDFKKKVRDYIDKYAK
jgi:ubiquitin-protein ligase